MDYNSPSEEDFGRMKEREEIVAFLEHLYDQYESLWDLGTKDLMNYIIRAIELKGFGNR